MYAATLIICVAPRAVWWNHLPSTFDMWLLHCLAKSVSQVPMAGFTPQSNANGLCYGNEIVQNKYPNVWCSLSVHVSHSGCNFPTKSCRERHIKSHISGYQWDIRKRVGRRLSGLSVSLLYIWRTSQRRILLEKALQSPANYYTRSCWPICFHTSLSAQGLAASCTFSSADAPTANFHRFQVAWREPSISRRRQWGKTRQRHHLWSVHISWDSLPRMLCKCANCLLPRYKFTLITERFCLY